MTGDSSRTVVTLPSDLEIRVSRFFDAPPSLVFELWTMPALVRRWWPDPSAPLLECEIDLREGGHWRYSTGSGARDLTWHGTFLEVKRPRLLRSIEVFGSDRDAQAKTTLVLEACDGGTTSTITVLHRTRANRDRHLAMGMEQGLRRSLRRIDRLITELDTPDTEPTQEVNR